MLLKYYCSECGFNHIEEFSQGEYMLEGAHEVDCPETGIELCVDLELASEEEYEKYLWYVSIMKNLLIRLKSL